MFELPSQLLCQSFEMLPLPGNGILIHHHTPTVPPHLSTDFELRLIKDKYHTLLSTQPINIFNNLQNRDERDITADHFKRFF